jgi:flagellar biosynthesis GTPase FlhF
LEEPKLVDEYITLIQKNTGIPQFSVTLQDLQEAMKILTGSEIFWPKARNMGLGAKLNRGKKTRPQRQRSVSSSSSSSDDSDSSSSTSSSSSGSEAGGGLELGFSDDEAANKPAPAPVRRRPVTKKKAKAKNDSSESDSSDSESSAGTSSNGEDESMGEPEKKSPERGSAAEEKPSSSSSSSEEEAEDKKARKKKLAGLAARRRAEQAEQQNEQSTQQPKSAARKLRQPYAYQPSGQKENVHIPNPPPKVARPVDSPSKPSSPIDRSVKKPRIDPSSEPAEKPKETAVSPTESPPVSPPLADWASDFGRLVRQAIDNRRICPFRTLGLGPSSSMAEVKKRWAKLCLLLHPDKAPVEWKAVPELVDANQAVNEAKKTIEQRFQAVALVRPQKPLNHSQPYTLDKGTFGKRRVEIRWQPSPVPSAREKVERYLVFIIHGNDPRRRDQMLNAGSVKEGTDPFFVIVEDDQRFARFFNSNQITVSILASNAAGNSDPLTVVVPLR